VIFYTVLYVDYIRGLNELMIQWALRSADIGDCHLFVVRNDAEAAQCRGDAHEDKILVACSCFVICRDK
jgi:hypothetical protein